MEARAGDDAAWFRMNHGDHRRRRIPSKMALSRCWVRRTGPMASPVRFQDVVAGSQSEPRRFSCSGQPRGDGSAFAPRATGGRRGGAWRRKRRAARYGWRDRPGLDVGHSRAVSEKIKAEPRGAALTLIIPSKPRFRAHTENRSRTRSPAWRDLNRRCPKTSVQRGHVPYPFCRDHALMAGAPLSGVPNWLRRCAPVAVPSSASASSVA